MGNVRSISNCTILLILIALNSLTSTETTTSSPCDCLQMIGSSSDSSESKDRFQICYSSDKPFGQVYDSDNEVCYNLLEQGPCEIGHLLSRDMKSYNSLRCLPACNREGELKEEWQQKLRNGKCALPHQQLSDNNRE